MKRSKGEKIFGVFNGLILIILAIIALYPFIYVIVASFSDPMEVASGHVWLYPIGINLSAYEEVIHYEGIWVAYANTFFYAIVGTLVSIVVTILGAYPLSKKRLRGKTIFTFLIAFSMWFQAGMIPTYLNFKDLGLLDTRTAIIVGFCVTAFYLFIMRTYFTSLPDALEESAKLDGANDFQILLQIYLPLAIPSVVTLMLYYLVDRWNAYFWAMTLLKDESKIPLQVILNKLIVEGNWSEQTGALTDSVEYNQETLKYATIVVAIIPVLCVYPVLQKYFVKGMTVGAIKG
ncbi:carbohydrate ABC transporter permease [Ructibacterium gallinarum]|uniref:Carbohydrate ABC transporter permease n=1 Tax=Ructibacterium gallinarum TaxID=2779355 RepID=A0A9D5R9M1_9FIRM|nr:carbohydrate ABC transporter permease [Ructibacterium gallinarum]MBE5041172.1 carbohydrate ABC transporter permease [Ructibacterium gallinarum]